MILALVGNQNCGKTTLFNRLTGANQHVGNFPGVTVEKKSGDVRGVKACTVVDLPGVYSLRTYTIEEVVTKDFITNEKPDGIINIVDATNLERNLYFTMQLLEMKIPMVVALNMMDELRGGRGKIDVELLSKRFGVKFVPISALKNEGIDTLVSEAVKTVEEKSIAESLPWDHRKIAQNNEIDCDAEYAERRYSFIEEVCNEAVKKPDISRKRIMSVKLDKFLTGKFTAVPCFAAIILLVFYLTFNVIGKFLSDFLADGIALVTELADNALSKFGINEIVHSLVIEGIFAGVGGVLGFLPVIVTLFFFLSILEDTGYMARVAFVMDRFMRKIGLSGKSIVPLLIGFGCSVPAIMSTRTLGSERDRKMTILLTPFMSCSAKLPVYAFLVSVFFEKWRPIAMTAIYFTGIFVGIFCAVILNKTYFRGSSTPFIMELPNYRLPSVKSVFLLMWDKAKDFVQKAFTVIFLCSVIIWFLQTFDICFNVVQDNSMSLLAMLGRLISPIFAPLGLSDWRISTALVSGISAKESVVSTLEILIGNTPLRSLFTIPSAVAFLIFTLLYTPCVAAISAMHRELGGSKLKTLAVVVLQCGVAWVISFAVYRFILIF